MAHEHIIVDTDVSFVIDPITRAITTESSKLYLTQYDHNSEKYTFKIPRIIEGHDISDCDTIMIDFDNANRRKTLVNSGSYKVKEIVAEEDNVLFTWTVSRESTQIAGSLSFSVSFRCYDDDGNIIYEFGTDKFNKITILEKSRYDQTTVTNYPDLIEQIKEDILDVAVTSVNGETPDENGDVSITIPEGFSGSWNDLTDKPFYEEDELVVVSECEVTSITTNEGWRNLTDGNGNYAYPTNCDLPLATYVYGDDYVIDINGETYNLKLSQSYDGSYGGVYYLGFNVAGGWDTHANLASGAKFAIFTQLGRADDFVDGETFEGPLYCYLSSDIALPATIKIKHREKVLKQLDPKYIKDMYYTETVQKSETREFTEPAIQDLEFAQLLYEHRKDAVYIIEGEKFVYNADNTGGPGYEWTVIPESGGEESVMVALPFADPESATLSGNILFAPNASITINYGVEESHKIDPKYLPDSALAQSDWSQNDPAAPDYVKNRPFYASDPIEHILLDKTYEATEDGHFLSIGDRVDITIGKIVHVEFDGVSYECEVFNAENYPMFGNCSGSFGFYGGNSEPFCFWNQGMLWLRDKGTHTIKVKFVEQTFHKINNKFLQGGTIATTRIDNETGEEMLDTEIPSGGHYKVYDYETYMYAPIGTVPPGAILNNRGRLCIDPLSLPPQKTYFNRNIFENLSTTIGNIYTAEFDDHEDVSAAMTLGYGIGAIECCINYKDFCLRFDAHINRDNPSGIVACGTTCAGNGMIYTAVFTLAEDGAKFTLDLYCKG